MAPTLVNLSLEHILLAGNKGTEEVNHIRLLKILSFVFTYFLYYSNSSSSSFHFIISSHLFLHKYLVSSVRYLGKFHGNCYAMKELNNDEFHGIARQLARTRFEKEQPPGMWANLSQLAPLRGIDAVRSRRYV